MRSPKSNATETEAGIPVGLERAVIVAALIIGQAIVAQGPNTVDLRRALKRAILILDELESK